MFYNYRFDVMGNSLHSMYNILHMEKGEVKHDEPSRTGSSIIKINNNIGCKSQFEVESNVSGS